MPNNKKQPKCQTTTELPPPLQGEVRSGGGLGRG